MRLTPIAASLLSLVSVSVLAHDDQANQPNDAPPFSAHFYADGVAYHASKDLRVQEALGIYNVHSGHEGGGHSHSADLRNGLNFNNAEAHFAMNFPRAVDGRLSLSINGDGLALEEGWLRTQFLAAGFQLKGGKMLSDVGYLNNKHPHAWDFVDQALPYQMLLNGALSGTGLQANWYAPTPFELRMGAEALTGGNEGIAARVGEIANPQTGKPLGFAQPGTWPNVWTAFIKARGEVAEDHHLHAGLSWIKSDLHQEMHTYHPGINDATHGLQGTARMLGTDLRYHYHADGQHGAGDWIVQAEYWYQEKDLSLVYHELKPKLVGQPRDLKLDGAYIQALYGVAPRWQAGVRVESTGMTHEASRARATFGPTNSSQFDALNRISGVLTWKIDAHQQLRFQLSRISGSFAEQPEGASKAMAVDRDYNEVFLQYQLNFGTRSGHAH